MLHRGGVGGRKRDTEAQAKPTFIYFFPLENYISRSVFAHPASTPLPLSDTNPHQLTNPCTHTASLLSLAHKPTQGEITVGTFNT